MGVRPDGQHGPAGGGLDTLMECLTWQGAQRVADWLVRAARPSSATSDAADFWYGATTKALAPILLAAACSGGTMAQVVQWVDGQEDEPVRFALEANGEEEAVTAFEAISMWDERTRGSVYATAQTVLIAYTDPGVLASAMSAELRAKHLLDGGCHTAYLCAPAHEQRRLQPLFATLVQEIVAHAYDRATETGTPLDPPLLLVLDECANIAPLRELATLASTGAGQGIQLVSVFQDMAQINAVYGRDRAPTIVSNHRAKVILSGIADPHTLEYLVPTARRRGGTPGIGDLGRRGPPLHHRVRRLPQPRARQCAPGDAAGPGHPRLRPPPSRADRAATLVQRTPAASTREATPAPYGGRATVKTMLEDLSTLPPKRLEKQLEKLAHDALPCHAVTVFEGSPTRASPSRSTSTRADEATFSTSPASSRTIQPFRRPAAGRSSPRLGDTTYWRLLLRVSFERPVHCALHRRLRRPRPPERPAARERSRSSSPPAASSSPSTDGSTPNGQSSGSRRRSHASLSSSCSRPSAYSSDALYRSRTSAGASWVRAPRGISSSVRSAAASDARSIVRDWCLASSSEVTVSASRASARSIAWRCRSMSARSFPSAAA